MQPQAACLGNASLRRKQKRLMKVVSNGNGSICTGKYNLCEDLCPDSVILFSVTRTFATVKLCLIMMMP